METRKYQRMGGVKGERLIELPESKVREMIWELKNFSQRLRADADYYEKKTNELRETLGLKSKQ